jgi:hypothetical protein
MRVYTKLSAIISEDAAQKRRLFAVEDLEENDDLSVLSAGSPGGLSIPPSGTLVVSLQNLAAAKQLVLLVNGSVNVKLNNSLTLIKVQSTQNGADAKTFVWGKLVLSGTEITGLSLTNLNASTAAQCMLGYAG